jgi:hypothetical protein
MDDIKRHEGTRTPAPYHTPRTHHPVPITVCTPAWLGVTLNLVKQRTEPTGAFLDLINGFSLEQLEEERDKLLVQMAAMTTATQLLELAISARRAANGDKTVSAPPAEATATAPAPGLTPIGARPRLKQAILRVMADGPKGHEWTPSELHSALDDRGWAPTGTAARAQISNRLGDLVEALQLAKPGKGRYVL